MDSRDVAANFLAQMEAEAKGTLAAPAQPAAVPQAAPLMVDASALAEVLRIILSREARLEAQEQQKIEAEQRKDVQRRANAREFTRNLLLTQAQCKHRKGIWPRLGTDKFPGPVTVDHAVYLHTFSDRKRTIKCQLCKMTWKPDDTKQYLVQNGVKITNHTGIGWEDAFAMVNQSSNKASSAEAPLFLPDSLTKLIEGRGPDFLTSLLQSPEVMSYLERTKAPAQQ
jgi:hypothetical protein